MPPASEWADVPRRLAAVRQRIRHACESADHDPAAVTLIAVAKTFPADAVAAAHDAGQIDFGENRVQEGLAKIDELADRGIDGPRIHLIGQLQRNKARHAGSFASVQSIDSLRLAETVSRRLDPDRAPLPVLLEVNLAGEASKGGMPPGDLEAALRAVAALPNLHVDGLMTVPPLTADPEDVRPYFRTLRQLRDRLGLRELSMGMSNDYAVAIAEGATMVRIGRAIFGERGERPS